MSLRSQFIKGVHAAFNRVPKAGKPAAGEATGPQNTMVGPGLTMPGGMSGVQYQQAGGSLFSGFGGGIQGMFGTAYPGMAFGMAGTFWGINGSGGFVQPRKGSYGTYRLMSLDPTLRVIRQIITAPILASQWTVQAVEGKKPRQAWLDAITAEILPLRQSILRESLRYLEFGWRPFERVYEIENGTYVLKKLKPLLPEFCQILTDGHGAFAGLTTNTTGGDGPLLPNKAWIVTNDGEAGNMYGMSRHEAAYDAWVDTQYARLRAAMLAGKLSGVQPMVYYRPGLSPVSGGKLLMPDRTTPAMDNGEIAARLVDKLFGGKGVAIPTTDFTDSELQENPKLAEAVSWRIELFNAGSYSPAMDGIIRERQYQDVLKVRAWGWPERAALEAEHGSKADSQQHTDTASLDIKLIDDDIAIQVSRGQPENDVPGLIDESCVLKFGEEARGTIEVKPAPLTDPKLELYAKLIDAVFANPTLAPEFAKVPDWEDVFSHLDISAADGAIEKLPAALQKAIDAAAKAAAPPPTMKPRPGQPMGGKSANGNGRIAVK